MTLELDNAGQRAVLALHLAGFDAAALPTQLLDAQPQDSFELSFERADGGALVLAFDAASARFELEESLGTELPADRDELALMLNASLEPHQRIGKHPETRRLFASASLSQAQAEVSALAAELDAIARLAQLLREAGPNRHAGEPGAPGARQAPDWALRA